MAYNHRVWAAHTVERRLAWHAIITFGQHKWSNDVERGMPSSPRDSTHGRTTSGMSCYHRLWAAQTVRRRWAWHAITALGQHTWSDDVGRGMPSSPCGSTNGRTTLGVACHDRPWAARTIEQRRAWLDITTLGQHTWSNDIRRTRSNHVGLSMPSSRLGSTHGPTTSAGMPSSPLGSTNC